MVDIVFEAHATTNDNKNKVASGWADVDLSESGIQQASELGQRYKYDSFDAIYCSDLQRSYKTAELAFGDKFPIFRDARLRECDYGEFTQKDKGLIDIQKAGRVTVPFEGGESYEQTRARVGDFLNEVKKSQDGKRIMIIGHRATQYGLEHFINNVSIIGTVTAPWNWQPGWNYRLV